MELWQLGDVKVTRVVDLVWIVSPRLLFPDATPESLEPMRSWLAPQFLREDGRIPLSIHTFIVESCGLRILVDTCIGEDKPRPVPEWDHRTSTFLEELEAAGAPPESIDRVLCTHLHVDHVGWNTQLRDGRWVPTFPSARYLITRREWEFWKDEEDALNQTILADSVRPVLDAGLCDLVDVDHEVTSEVRLLPTPGHTPGHVSIGISSRGREAVITGDMVHHPLQCAHPDWKDNFDTDEALAYETRTRFMERYADTSVLILGTHFADPTSGRIVRDGKTWRFEI
ncbi:MAG: MBL fold metallo-hydrolase [Myxococcota bacterium]